MKTIVTFLSVLLSLPILVMAEYKDFQGTVIDTSTGLQWQAGRDVPRGNWWQAKRYCEDLVLAGHADWRLPSFENGEDVPFIDELKMTDAVKDSNGTVSYQWSLYWSASESKDYATKVRYKSIDSLGHSEKKYIENVRCVRDVN